MPEKTPATTTTTQGGVATPKDGRHEDGRHGDINENVLAKRREPRQDAFLAAYARLGTIQAAADHVGMHRQGHYRWLDLNEGDYRTRWDAAQQTFNDSLEKLAFDRIQNPEGNRGSDVLLITMLNAHKPEKYKRMESPNSVAADLVASIKAMAKERTVKVRAIEVELDAEDRTEALLEAKRGDDAV